jgi:hypothetical protein
MRKRLFASPNGIRERGIVMRLTNWLPFMSLIWLLCASAEAQDVQNNY